MPPSEDSHVLGLVGVFLLLLKTLEELHHSDSVSLDWDHEID